MSNIQALEQQLAKTQVTAERLALFLQLGPLYEAGGDIRNMARCFYEANAIDRSSLVAVQGARRAYLRARKWEGAIAWFLAELRLQPDLEARAALLCELGDLRRNELNDPDGAQLEYSKASQLRLDARPTVVAPTAAPAEVVLEPPPHLPPPPPPAAAPGGVPPAVEHERPRNQPELRETGGGRSVPLWPLALLAMLGGGAGAWWKFKPPPRCPPGQLHRRDAFLMPDTLGDVAFAEGCWADTHRIGAHRFFNDAGVETAAITYQAGLAEGAARWIALDGGHESGLTVQGQQTGEWITSSADAVVVSKAMYRNGLREGPERVLFPDGGLHIAGFWSAGRQEGEWSQYYEDGKLWMRGKFKSGVASGKWQRFDPAGAFVWVTPESGGPRALRSEASLFAGRPLTWWNLRLAELRSDAARAPDEAERKARLDLTLHRAQLCDLVVDAKTQMLKPVVADP